MAAEGLIVAKRSKLHHDADHILSLGKACNPAQPFVSHKGILRPRGIVEAKPDVVGELVVAKDEREARVLSTGIDVVRTLPTEDVLCSLDHYALEAHVSHHRTNLVVVDERRVAEHLRVLSEELLDFLCLTLCLCYEVIDVAKRREAVTVRLGQELHTARRSKPSKQVEHFGSILFDKLQGDTADAECHLEGLSVLGNHVEHCLQGRLVALLEEFVDDALVLVVVVVIVVGANVEETITLEVYRLVYLEV